MTDLEKMLRRVIGEDIDLRTNFQPNLGVVKAQDPGQVEQLVMNLVVSTPATPCPRVASSPWRPAIPTWTSRIAARTLTCVRALMFCWPSATPATG